MRGQGVQRGRGSPARMNIPMGRGRGVQPQPVQTRVPPRKNRNAPSQVKFNFMALVISQEYQVEDFVENSLEIYQ